MRRWLLGCLFLTAGLAFPGWAASPTPQPSVQVIEKHSQEIVRFNEKIVVAQGQTVDGDVVAVGGPIDVKGTVNGNAVAIGGNVALFPGGRVHGDAVAIGGRVAKMGGSLTGSETSLGPTVSLHPERETGNDWLWKVLRAIGMLALITLLAALFPRPMERMRHSVEQAPWAAFLWGIVAMLLFTPIAFLLVLSLVGILFVPLEVLLYLAAALFGATALSALIGGRLLQGKGNLVLHTLLGAFVVLLVGLVPFLGWLLKLVLVLFGLGAVLMSRFGSREATTIQ